MSGSAAHGGVSDASATSGGPDRIRGGRSRAPLSEEGVHELLAASRKMQLATINPDGTPHLVTMYYVLLGGRIAFWTYRASQKARNLARDPRLTVLVEDGEQYFDLRGVQICGIARPVEDQAQVARIGGLVAARLSGVPTDAVGDYVQQAARKRIGYVVEPARITGWDHRSHPSR